VDAAGSFVYQLNQRNSVSVTGGAVAMRRAGPILIGMNGTRAGADYVRRLNRTTSIGVGFSYMHIEYPRAFGSADIASLMLQGAKLFGKGRRWQVSGTLGAYRLDFTGIRQVTLDPVIAELLGQLVGREAFHTINTLAWVPSVSPTS